MPDYKNIISELIDINQKTGAPDLTQPASNLVNNTHGRINVAVLGQFKSGKSSLINSLAGEDILPVGVIPVTAIITQLHYGAEPILTIHYKNGYHSRAELTDLSLYVTEKQNPANKKEVSSVTIEHPSLKAFQNVCLVDTPGLGSIYRHNSGLTRNWLPYSGIALITISAERPLAEEDIQLITDVSQYCPEITLLITKADLFNERSLQEIRSYIQDSVKDSLGYAPSLFNYSIFKNENIYRENLVEQFILPIHLHASKKQDEILNFKMQAISEQSLRYAQIAYQAALKKDQDKRTLEELLQSLKNNKRHFDRDMLLSGSAFKGGTREKLENIFMPLTGQVTRKVFQDFSKDFPLWQGTLFKVSRQFESWLGEKLGLEIFRINNLYAHKVEHLLKEVVDYYEYSALQFRQRLKDRLHQTLGVELPLKAWRIDFNEIDKPEISIYRVFDSHLDLFLFFLPIRYMRPVFFSHFRKQIPYEVEKNFQRYVSDVNGKIIKAIDQIQEEVSAFIIDEIQTVDRLISANSQQIDIHEKNIQRLGVIKSLLS